MLKGRFEKLLIKGLLWVLIFLLVGFAIFMAGVVWEVRGKERLAWQEKENARLALSDIEKRYESLSRDVKNFEHERGLEEEFRKRFPVAKEGEEVVVLVDAPPAESDTDLARPQGLWGTLQSWFSW